MQEETKREGVRINRYLSMAGICSRREADRKIAAGKVWIDGRKAVPGDLVNDQMHVTFDGREVKPEPEEILIAFYKPVGVVCTTQKKEKNNIIDYIGYPKRIYPVGRLDRDSEGLILLTNQGGIVNRIMRAGNCHEKEYVVTVDREIDDAFLKRIGRGVFLPELAVTTRACRVRRRDAHTFVITLTQGYNRQIRRMCEACGCRVRRLVRVRIMNILLGDLAPGTYRDVTEAEKRQLYEMLKHSYSAPAGAGTDRGDR